MNLILQVYRSTFVRMLKTRNSGILSNSSREHAKVILQELFRFARKRILLQCSKFAKDIYCDKETQDLIKGALRRGVNVHIFIREAKADSNDFASELNSLVPGTVKVGETLSRTDFCAADDAYRIEMDETRGKALVCANAPHITQKLFALDPSLAS